jgi:hypothetical protein
LQAFGPIIEKEVCRENKQTIALVAFKDVGWRVEVLVEGLLTAKRPVALVALVYWSVGWGIDVLVEGLLAAK